MTIPSYIAGSAVLAGLVVTKVYELNDEQVYPTLVHLIASNGCCLVMINLFAAVLMLVGMGVTRLSFGRLRPAESEYLWEELPPSLFELLLNLAIFRGELDSRTIALFLGLLLFKPLHWLLEKRIDFWDTAPFSFFASLRVNALIVLLFAVDVLHLCWAVSKLISEGPSVIILFTLEYTLLVLSLFTQTTRLWLTISLLYRQQAEPHIDWSNRKSTCMMILELISSVIRMITYTIFFVVISRTSSFPLHLIRSVYLSWRAVHRAISNFFEYKAAIRRLQLFPDATPDELRDQICPMCRDQMLSAKKIPGCGHLVHLGCLQDWLKHRRICPACTAPIPEHPLPIIPIQPQQHQQHQQQQLFPQQQQLPQQQQPLPLQQQPFPQQPLPQQPLQNLLPNPSTSSASASSFPIHSINGPNDPALLIDAIERQLEETRTTLDRLKQALHSSRTNRS